MPKENPSICLVSQGYKQNLNELVYGPAGHSGVDEVCGYGTPVYSLKKGFVYKILDKEHPAMDGSGFYGVFIITTDGDLCEWQIGHCSKIFVKVGDKVDPWTIVGEEGNRGTVFQNGVMITKAMQDAGDIRGSHRHWNKKELIRIEAEQIENVNGQFITAFSATQFPPKFQDENGYFYQIRNYSNGLKGSVDPIHDLNIGYDAVRKHLAEPVSPEVSPADAKIITDGLKAVSWAIKYPMLWGTAMNILKGLSAFLGKKRP